VIYLTDILSVENVLFALLGSSLTFLGKSYADPITDPTHFDDTYWNWPTNSTGYSEMDTDITPLVDGSPDGYYYSAYYWFAGDYPATGGYLGLQTEGSVPTGKIAIFSIWDATASNGPGYNASGVESGETYYTSRINYPWVVNHTYDLKISITTIGPPSEIWTAWVTDENTGVQSVIGSITVPYSRGFLYDQSSTFHERYSGPTAACSDMQESEVEYTNLTADNGSDSPVSHSNVGPTGSACASDFATKDITGGIESIVGGQFPVVPSTITSTPSTSSSKAPTTTKPSTTAVASTPSPSSSPSPSPTVTASPDANPVLAITKAPTQTPTISSKPKAKHLSTERVAAYTTGIGLFSIVIIPAIAFGINQLLIRRRVLAPEPIVDLSTPHLTLMTQPQTQAQVIKPNLAQDKIKEVGDKIIKFTHIFK
jgi:hypothetical protein